VNNKFVAQIICITKHGLNCYFCYVIDIMAANCCSMRVYPIYTLDVEFGVQK